MSPSSYYSILLTQKISLEHRYENDRLEQYTRMDNLRILGMEEEIDEDEELNWKQTTYPLLTGWERLVIETGL